MLEENNYGQSFRMRSPKSIILNKSKVYTPSAKNSISLLYWTKEILRV